MTRRLSILALLASALTACQLGGSTTHSSASDACKPVGAACDSDASCCSFGCDGVCVANPLPGGMCKTTDDCGYAQTGTPPYFGTTKMTCKAGACTTANVCRDDADVCTYDDQCCAGNCMGSGHCGPNHPPFIDLGPDRFDVPYTKLVTLTPVSVGDPDGDALIYGWTLVSKPATSVAALSSATAATPTFTPDKPGDYVVSVVVTDGIAPRPNRLTATDTLTLHVANTVPVVNAGPDVAHASRNVLQNLYGTVSDPDGDPLTCTWKVRAPGGTDQIVQGPTTCLAAFNSAFTPSGGAPVEGDWIATLEVTDGVHTVTDTATFTCVNDPPVAIAGTDQIWNIGVTPVQNPTVPLAGAFTDLNGDAASSWAWSVISAPAGSAINTATLTNGATQNASFVADKEGRYVLQVEVCDRAASCGTDSVNVDVLHAIREFADGRVVRATDYAHAADKIAIAGEAPAGSGVVWLYDVVANTETPASLDGVPTSVAVAPDGTYAVAANSYSVWVVKFSTTTTVTKLTNSAGSVGNIALAPGRNQAFLFPASTGTVYRFDYVNANTSTTLTTCTASGLVVSGMRGRADKESANLFVLGSSSLTRYGIANNGNFALSYGASASTYSTDFWVSQSSAYLFTSSGGVWVASTLAQATPLGISPSFLDSLSDGRVAAATPSAIALFTTGLSRDADDPFPQWGISGVGHGVAADGVFLRATDPMDATKSERYAVIHTTGVTPARSGLVTYP
jgi:hypothetical protein